MSKLQKKLYKILYRCDTFGGKIFSLSLIISIFTIVSVSILNSVPSFHQKYGTILATIEYVTTIFFIIEYIARIVCSYKNYNYIFSFMGIIDFIALLPLALVLFLPLGESYSFSIIRLLRILVIFRLLNLKIFIKEINILHIALKASLRKILIFFIVVTMLAIIFGSLIYAAENKYNDSINSIPDGIYWAIVTITTVGYGDIYPITELGKFISSIIILLSYAILAVPTGIISAQLIEAINHASHQYTCRICHNKINQKKSHYCNMCGHKIIKNK